MTIARPLALATALLLVACANPVAEPAAARLTRHTLTVDLTDGSRCSADLAGDAPWSGEIPGCGLHYVVTPTAAGSPIRQSFDVIIAALRAGDLVAPMADITVTDGAGQTHVFTSPVVDDP